MGLVIERSNYASSEVETTCSIYVAPGQTVNSNVQGFVNRGLTYKLIVNVSSSSVGQIFAAHEDLPDYSVVPQPTHYWNIDEGSGDLTDTGSDSTKITLADYGSPTWINDWAARSNQAVDGDAANNYFTDTVDSDWTNPGANFSAMVEFYTEGLTEWIYPLLANGNSGNRQWGFILASYGTIYFGTVSPYYYAEKTSIPTGTWLQVVGVCDSGTMKIYVNGIKGTDNSSYSSGPDSITTTQSFKIFQSGASRVSRAAIWNGIVLTETQIQNLYNTWVDCGGALWKRHPDDVESFQEESLGDYNFSLYEDSTFVGEGLLYSALTINASVAYVDPLPFFVKDGGGSHEAHIQIQNLDATRGMTFNVTLYTEKFA